MQRGTHTEGYTSKEGHTHTEGPNRIGWQPEGGVGKLEDGVVIEDEDSTGKRVVHACLRFLLRPPYAVCCVFSVKTVAAVMCPMVTISMQCAVSAQAT